MDFEAQMAAFAKKANMSIEKTVKGTSIKLFSAIIKSSPVDTGRFRNNWFAAFGRAPSSEVTTYRGTAGGAAINRVVAVVNSVEGVQEFTLANNLPYAHKLEFGGYSSGPNTAGGFSRQSPNGMVRVNADRFQRILDEQARLYK